MVEGLSLLTADREIRHFRSLPTVWQEKYPPRFHQEGAASAFSFLENLLKS
jgi:hypothetical protein